MAVTSLATLLCLGMSCTIHIIPDGGDGTDNGKFLDQADASIVILQAVGDATAAVTATLSDSRGAVFHLTGDEAVQVNNVDLTGPNAQGKYTATVEAVNEYRITVNEPSRGVEETALDRPADFEITSPAEGGNMSLSGFTLTWSGANSRLQVEIRLSQTFETTRTVTLGPFTDTGSRELTAQDLEPFLHGGDLTLNITLTKINTVNNVDGFNTGVASSRVSASRVAKPGP
jgi:hypothetical protein